MWRLQEALKSSGEVFNSVLGELDQQLEESLNKKDPGGGGGGWQRRSPSGEVPLRYLDTASSVGCSHFILVAVLNVQVRLVRMGRTRK